jgi:PhzF family phenazine biosynthesis protein
MSMSKKPVKYYVVSLFCLNVNFVFIDELVNNADVITQVDAFTELAFKGNPAAVCLLEQEKDDEWLQALAAEFNINVTCYLIPVKGTSNPRFRLRWFTHIVEV